MGSPRTLASANSVTATERMVFVTATERTVRQAFTVSYASSFDVQGWRGMLAMGCITAKSR